MVGQNLMALITQIRLHCSFNPLTGNRGWTRAANWQLSGKCGCSRRALPVCN